MENNLEQRIKKIENERPKVGIGVLIFNNGKVLLGKRKGSHGAGFYSVPGGHMEWGESFADTVRREMREETGLEVKDIRLVCVLNNIVEGKHYVNVDFACEVIKGEPKLCEPAKCEGWGWYDINALPKPMFIISQRTIEHYKRGIIMDDPSYI
ncbi:MAG: NUDIX domain-containing protein [Candidatus Portnoybacteria bacterium]|nr:NUDIX domain-containing protein [Candidatus Portnoybacteria bacterium]